MKAIIKDIRTGALPSDQIVGYIVWLVGKSFWGWVAVLVIGTIILSLGR